MESRKRSFWLTILSAALVALPAALSAERGGSGAESKNDPLPPGARARLGSGRLVHSSQVFSLAFSPDGKQLVSTGADGQVRFWDVETGHELKRINPQSNAAPNNFNPYYMGVGLSPDGKLLGVSVVGKGILMYDVQTGKYLRQFGEGVNQGYGLAFAFSPDGKQLVMMGRNVGEKNVQLFETESGKELRKFEGHDNFAYCAAFIADGKTLVTGSEDQTIRLWQVETGKQIRALEGHRAGVLGVAVSPDGKNVASLSNDATLRIWDAESGANLHRFSNVRIYYNGYGTLNALRFSEEGKVLTACLSDGIHQWDVATGKELRKPAEGQVAYGIFALSPDGKTMARWNNTQQGRISLYDTATDKELLPAPVTSALALAVSPDGKFLATGGIDRLVHLWDMSTNEEVRRFEGHTGSVGFLFFGVDGKTLISASRDYNDRSLSIWDVQTGKELQTLRTGGNNLFGMAGSRDGRVIACLCQDQQGIGLNLFDTEARKEIRRIRQPGYFYTLALSPDGKSYVTQAQDGSLVIAEVAEGKETRQLLKGNTGAPFFAPDGKTIAVLGPDQSIRLIDARNGREMRHLGEKVEANPGGRVAVPRFPNQVNQLTVAFSADGRMLASPARDGSVALWELATGKLRTTFEGHSGMLTAMTFTPDGATLISSGQEGQVLFWDLVQGNKDDLHQPGEVTSTQAEELWNDLLGDDAARAYRAIRLLRAGSRVTMPFLKEHLRPAAGVDQKRLEKLIADLDSQEYDERARASQDLEKIGELAEPILRKTLEEKPSLEVSKRIEDLLRKIENHTLTGERLRSCRALEVIEYMHEPEARLLLESLAGGAEGAGLTREARAALQRGK
jgi:WD40 repeat protein